MMNLKTVLLAGVAAMLVTGAARAADPIVPAPESDVAAPAAAVCDVFGAGFIALPGTESCLKFGGRVRATAVSNEDLEDVATGVEARVNFDVRSNTEAGVLRTFVQLENEPGTEEIEVDEAFVQLGGLLIGHTKTLFNTDYLYGDGRDFELDIENSNQVRYTYDFGQGVYVAGSVEDGQREGLSSFHNDENKPDFAGKVGIVGQTWGSADVSAIYSSLDDAWGVKATGDLTVTDAIDARISAAYFDADEKNVTLGAAARVDLAAQFAAYVGGVYSIQVEDGDFFDGFQDGAYGANVGLEYTPVSNLTFQGEVGYADDRTNDEWTTMLRVSRGW